MTVELVPGVGLAMTETATVPELGLASTSPGYDARTDVDPIGIADVTSVATQLLSKHGLSADEPSTALAVPLVAVKVTDPLGVTPSPPTPSTLTVAFRVTAVPSVELLGVAVTAVDVESSPAAGALGAVINANAAAVPSAVIPMSNRRRLRVRNATSRCITPPAHPCSGRVLVDWNRSR